MAKKKKMNFGGKLIDIVTQAATGNFLGAGASALQGVLQELKPADITIDATYNSKPYGNMARGGSFKQYNAPSHAQGGQTIDENGNPTTVAPAAEIQNQENSFDQYVYSDTLKNPKTGRTFNVDMSKIMNKYKNPETDLLEKRGLGLEANTLAKTNDTVKSIVESIEGQMQGEVPEMFNGGPTNGDPMVPTVNDPWGGINPNLPYIDNPFTGMVGAVDRRDSGFTDPLPNGTMKAMSPQGIQPLPNGNIKPVSSFNVSDSILKQFSTSDQAPPEMGELNPGIGQEQGRNFNFNTAALVAKGLGLAGSIKRALDPAQIETARIPDYQPADNSFDRASIDYTAAEQAATGASNLLGQTNRAASSGFGQYRNREAARIASLQDTLANINMSERNANAQLDMSRGQYRANKAQDIANRLREVDVANLQNIASKQAFGDQLGSEFTQIGSSLNKYQVFQDELKNRRDIADMNVNEFMALAKAKGLNFSLGEADEFLNSIKSGKNPIKYSE